jgi:hypothetical protein
METGIKENKGAHDHNIWEHTYGKQDPGHQVKHYYQEKS